MAGLRLISHLELPMAELRDDAKTLIDVSKDCLRVAELILGMTDEERAYWESGEVDESDPTMAFIGHIVGTWGDPQAFVSSIQINLMLSLETLEACGRDPRREAQEMLDSREVRVSG